MSRYFYRGTIDIKNSEKRIVRINKLINLDRSWNIP